MTRQLTPNAIAKINTKIATEPINIITAFGMSFADKDIYGVQGKILEISSLDEVVKIDNQGSSGSISVKLDDTDGSIKAVLDSRDIHKAPCNVYQAFAGTSLDDKFLLFEGLVSSPIIWSEGDRTVSFEVLTRIESYEVGFAPIEGQFPDVFNYTPWPLGFGDVVHVPATKINTTIGSVIDAPVVIVDPTLSLKAFILAGAFVKLTSSYNNIYTSIQSINQNYRKPNQVLSDYASTIIQEDQLKQQREDIAIQLDAIQKILDNLNSLASQAITGSDQSDIQQQTQDQIDQNQQQLDQVTEQYQEITSALLATLWNKRFLEIETDVLQYKFQYFGSLYDRMRSLIGITNKIQYELGLVNATIANQQSYLVNQVGVVNGYLFPQNVNLEVTLNGVKFSGQFNNNTFTIYKPLPTYTNITFTPSTSDPRVFFIVSGQDSDNVDVPIDTINLKGMLCRLPDNRIMMVRDQILNMCTVDPDAYNLSQFNLNAYANADQYYTNYTNYVQKYQPSLLDNTLQLLQGAQEYTSNERERLLLDAVTKVDYTGNFQAVQDALKELTNLQGVTIEDQKAIETGLSKNANHMQEILNDIIIPDNLIANITRLVSDDEYNYLKKLEILNASEIQRTQALGFPVAIDDATVFYFNMQTIPPMISEACPIVLDYWLTPYYKSAEEFIGGSVYIDDGLFHIPPTRAWVAQTGASIQLYGLNQNKYVANLISSEVKAVYAFRNVGGLKTLVPVPDNYYTINEADDYGQVIRDNDTFVDVTATTITLIRPLSDYSVELWEDDAIYVSYSSSVGPNTADIIEWLINTYSIYDIDTASFAQARASMANFPSSFAIFDKPLLLQVIQDIAWQARCTLSISDNLVRLIYLPKEPNPVQTITEADIVENTMSITYTETENIVTKLVALWRQDYSQTTLAPIQTIIRHNVNRYNVQRRDYNFFIYNNISMIQYAATFWSIRLSNTWKLVEFDSFLTTLGLQTNDSVILNVSPNYYATGPIKCIVDKADYDSATQTVKMRLWLPVRSGEMVPYKFVWTAEMSEQEIYPTVFEIAAGDAGNPINLKVGDDIRYNIQANSGFFGTAAGQANRPPDFGTIQISDLAAPDIQSPFTDLLNIVNKSVPIQDYTTNITSTVFPLNDNINPTSYSTKTTKVKSATQDQIDALQSPINEPTPTKTGRVIQKDDGDSDDGDPDSYLIAFSDGRQLAVDLIGAPPDTDLTPGTIVTVGYNKDTSNYEMVSPTDGSVQTKKVTITAINDDYLTCSTSNNSDSTINVLKPYILRRTPFDNKTIFDPLSGTNLLYFYTSSSIRIITDILNNYNQTQYIQSSYNIGDTIYIVSIPNETINEIKYIYLDLNTDARGWVIQ